MFPENSKWPSRTFISSRRSSWMSIRVLSLFLSLRVYVGRPERVWCAIAIVFSQEHRSLYTVCYFTTAFAGVFFKWKKNFNMRYDYFKVLNDYSTPLMKTIAYTVHDASKLYQMLHWFRRGSAASSLPQNSLLLAQGTKQHDSS